MDQQELREKLLNYVKENGLKYNYIAKKIGISKCHMSLFINNKRNFKKDKLEKLKEILEV